jgi:CHAT domain-containing protein
METMSPNLTNARIIHLGAHGVFDLQRPLDSYIQLFATGADDNGRLAVSEVYGLDLKHADLVVLSACETQVNQLVNPDDRPAVTAGDDLVGLTRAFFVAGTPTVVATLWQVDDAASALLMERFYTHLRQGLNKAEALRRAQQETRAEFPNPKDWAGFVLVGDGGGPSSSPWWVWALTGCGILLALASLALWWRRRQGALESAG